MAVLVVVGDSEIRQVNFAVASQPTWLGLTTNLIGPGGGAYMKITTPFKDLLPPLTSFEKENLKHDLDTNGQRESVLISEDNEILDGHNRAEILGDKARFHKIKIPKEERPAFVLAANLNRRNLTHDQRREILEKQKAIALVFNKAGWTQERIAGALRVTQQRVSEWLSGNNTENGNVSIRDCRTKLSADDKEFIISAGNDHATLVQAAAECGVTVKRAEQIIKAANRVKEDDAKESGAANDGRGDFTLTEDQSVVECQLLVTDPPYGILKEQWEPKELKKFTEAWLKRWNECGAELFFSFWSQRYLWEGKQWFDECLVDYSFHQLLVWHYPNNKSPQSRRGFKQTWEPIFFYRRKGSERQIRLGRKKWGESLTDFDCHTAAVPQSNFKQADRKRHPAQKPVSVFSWIINAASKEHELVCDPFCGVGTSGIAALRINRRWHGIEINGTYRTQARKRITCYGK